MRRPSWRYQLPFCGGWTNQFQIFWLFPIWSLLSCGKVIFNFFCNFYQKITFKFFFHPKKEWFFHENGQKHIFYTNISIFWFKYVISTLWEFFWGAFHVCRSKIHSTSVTFLSLRNLEAAPEEAMQLRRLIKNSNESWGPYLLGNLSSEIFRGPELR